MKHKYVAKRKYIVNGKTLTERQWRARMAKKDDSWLEGGQQIPNTYRDHDPLVSEGLGVLKHQVEEAREEIKKHNIQGVAVRNSGQLEITSRRGRQEYASMRRLVDLDGGYGD